VDDIRPEAGEGVAEHLVVVNFAGAERVDGCDFLSAECAVEEQRAVNFAVALFGLDAGGGGEHHESVAAQTKGFDDTLAMSVKSARVVGRIQIGQGQDFHVETIVQKGSGGVKNEGAWKTIANWAGRGSVVCCGT